MFKTASIIFSFLFFFNLGFAQTSAIKVNVIDSVTKQPLPFAQVLVQIGNRQIAGNITDENGYAEMKPLDSGNYDIIVTYEGYDTTRQINVTTKQDMSCALVIEMIPGVGYDFYYGKVIIDTTKREPTNIDLTTFHTFNCLFSVPFHDWGWVSGVFDRTDISRLPSTDINYLHEFFPKH